MARRDDLARVLAERFSTPYAGRNPDWDWEKPDGPDNQYHLERSIDERAKGSPWVIFTASDGARSMRVPTFYELADAIIEAEDG